MLYQEPEMEVLKWKINDVICASIVDDYKGNDGNESGVPGSWVPQ